VISGATDTLLKLSKLRENRWSPKERYRHKKLLLPYKIPSIVRGNAGLRSLELWKQLKVPNVERMLLIGAHPGSDVNAARHWQGHDNMARQNHDREIYIVSLRPKEDSVFLHKMFHDGYCKPMTFTYEKDATTIDYLKEGFRKN